MVQLTVGNEPAYIHRVDTFRPVLPATTSASQTFYMDAIEANKNPMRLFTSYTSREDVKDLLNTAGGLLQYEQYIASMAKRKSNTFIRK